MSTSARAKRRLLGAVLVVLGAISIAVVVWKVATRGPPSGAAQPLTLETRVEAAHESALSEPPIEVRAPRAVPVAEVVAESAPAPVAATPTGPPIRLWGTVRAARGVSPMESIHVTCTDGLGVSRSVKADERSRYAFDDLRPGRHWLRAGSDSLGVASAVVDLVGVDRVDLALEPERTLVVQIVDEADVAWRPPNVDFVVTRSAPGTWLGQGAHRATRARPPLYVDTSNPGPSETLVLTWPPPLQVSLIRYQLVLATQPVGEHDTELVFRVARDDARLADGTVRFRFVDTSTREPVTPPSVNLDGSEHRSLFAKTPAEGYGPVALRPGGWTLRTMGPGGAVRRSFRIEPGVDLDLGDIPVGGGATIRGRLLDDQGNGLAAAFQCEPCDEHGVVEPQTATLHSFKAKDDGSFELRGLTRGFYRLSMLEYLLPERARRDLVAQAFRLVDLRQDDASGIVLRAQDAVALYVRPSGRETMESGFRVLDAYGVVVRTHSIDRGRPVLVGLAPGVYDVERWHERDGPRDRVAIRIVDEPIGVDMP